MESRKNGESSVLVRATEPGDAEAVAEIFRCPRVIAGTLQIPYRSTEFRRQRLAERSPDTHPLVAQVEGRVVGVLTLHAESRPRRQHCGSLGMAVHDSFQGRGIGSALLAAAIELGENWLALSRIELTVYSDNTPALRLYEKFGFVIEGTARNFAFRDGAFVDAHHMARLRP